MFKPVFRTVSVQKRCTELTLRHRSDIYEPRCQVPDNVIKTLSKALSWQLLNWPRLQSVECWSGGRSSIPDRVNFCFTSLLSLYFVTSYFVTSYEYMLPFVCFLHFSRTFTYKRAQAVSGQSGLTFLIASFCFYFLIFHTRFTLLRRGWRAQGICGEVRLFYFLKRCKIIHSPCWRHFSQRH